MPSKQARRSVPSFAVRPRPLAARALRMRPYPAEGRRRSQRDIQPPDRPCTGYQYDGSSIRKPAMPEQRRSPPDLGVSAESDRPTHRMERGSSTMANHIMVAYRTAAAPRRSPYDIQILSLVPSGAQQAGATVRSLLRSASPPACRPRTAHAPVSSGRASQVTARHPATGSPLHRLSI